ncbi:MAG TPA: GAF domain-containing protein [Oligoflexia bacterium]|nr:GAF domain-containing protein [Oligoflexia bacterium]HMP49687.1 GAF domain-containing protein [Oligoflexia bacterium]
MNEHVLKDVFQHKDDQLVLKNLATLIGQLPYASQVIIVPLQSNVFGNEHLNPVEWQREGASKLLPPKTILRILKNRNRIGKVELEQHSVEGRYLISCSGITDQARLFELGICTDFELSSSYIDDTSDLIKQIVPLYFAWNLKRKPLLPSRSESKNHDNSITISEELSLDFLFREQDFIYFLVDFEGRIISTNGPAKELLGFGVRGLVGSRIVFEDQGRFSDLLDGLKHGEKSASGEFSVLDPDSGSKRFRFSFHVATNRPAIHVLAYSVNELHELSQRVIKQDRTIQALLDVTTAVGTGRSPAEIAEEGIRVLCEVTGATGGVCYLQDSRLKRDSKDIGLEISVRERAPNSPGGLKILSVYGVPPSLKSAYFENASPEIFNWATKSSDPIILPRIKADKDKHWWMIPSDIETGGTCVVVPVELAEKTLGVLVLLFTSERSIDSNYMQLMRTAASQIGLAARQAELILESRAQARAINARYRISHELSAFLSMEDVFQLGFQILHEELGIERYWLGLVNETGTRVVGQAAYGPGWKRKLVEIRVDISKNGHPMADVVRSKKPQLINNVEAGLPGLGLRRFILRHGIDSVALIPLVAGGQVLGVLALEGEYEGVPLDKEEMALLASLGAEIANVLFTKRLEERVGEGETMRAAGLLAAGIAHNFNNVLQGIMGQASLLDLYADKPELIKKSALTLQEAAAKGASLVKQLLSFAHLEEPIRDLCDIKGLIEGNSTYLQRLLVERQYIQYRMIDDLPPAFVDSRQVLRILQALLLNASEAMNEVGTVEIMVDKVSIDNDSPHFEVPFGDYIRVAVRDNGVGMDAETRKRCFEPFFTTKNVDPGSGLSLKGEGMGLAAAYALSRKNGGRLVVDSRKGQGSLFTLYLPVYVEMDNQSPQYLSSSDKSNIQENNIQDSEKIDPESSNLRKLVEIS